MIRNISTRDARFPSDFGLGSDAVRNNPVYDGMGVFERPMTRGDMTNAKGGANRVTLEAQERRSAARRAIGCSRGARVQLIAMGICFLAAAIASAAPPVVLGADHLLAVERPRRIVVQFDAMDHRESRLTPKEWLKYLFTYVDQSGSQIDSIVWDVAYGDWAVYPSSVLPPTRDPVMGRWRQEGFEFVSALVRECKRRKIEVWWNHRISEFDTNNPADGLFRSPLKAEHPDWTVRSWWLLWNLASSGLRAHKVDILREIATTLDFDGIQIDFSRHIPCLPPGQQWENREHATEFMRLTRRALLEVGQQRGRPVLLSAKVPENLPGCREDGFDVETWAGENLVDIFTLGSRTMDVDLSAFRRMVGGRPIKLHPSLDDHHATDGYRNPQIEFFRGVFSNWWRQGADAVCTFNWSAAPPEISTRAGINWSGVAYHAHPVHGIAYGEIGSYETMRFKDKIFAIERRGGLPWAEGYFGQNSRAPLPAQLHNDGRVASFTLQIADDLSAMPPRIRHVELAMVLFNTGNDDRLEVQLNGIRLGEPAKDPAWKDPQIFSPKLQRRSGGPWSAYKIDPEQKLSRFTFPLDARDVRAGPNVVTVRVVDRQAFLPWWIQVEKIELLVSYQSAN